MDLITAKDRNPKVLKKAQAFFDVYEQLPALERQGQLRKLARDFDVDWADAFRWAYVLRPGSLEAGGNWPYSETDTESVYVQDSLKKARSLEAPYEEEGESALDIESAALAGSDNEDLLKACANWNELREAQPVMRTGGRALYLESEDVFIVNLPKRANPVVMPRETHEFMLKAYSDWDGFPMRVEEICGEVGLTRKEFMQYKGVFGWTRKSPPFSQVELLQIDTDEAVDEIARAREAALVKKHEKAVANDDRADARKWRDLRISVLDHLSDAIQKVPTYEERTPKLDVSQTAEYNIIFPFNDWQVGAFASEARVRFGRQFDRDVFEAMIEDYIVQLEQYLRRNNGVENWGRPYITLLGDIMHGLIGETMHGTKLMKHMREFDWEQANVAVEALYRLTDVIVDFFGCATIIPLPGNHEGYILNILGEAMKQRYRHLKDENGDPAVVFIQHEKRTHHEMIGGSYFTFDHGASPDSNTKGGKVPRSGAARDSIIKDMVMIRPDYVAEAKRNRGGVYFVMGDQHHTIDESGTGVEVIKLPAIPSGDIYADENGWSSRPAQAVLLVEKNVGLRHMERFYFDNTRVFPA